MIYYIMGNYKKTQNKRKKTKTTRKIRGGIRDLVDIDPKGNVKIKRDLNKDVISSKIFANKTQIKQEYDKNNENMKIIIKNKYESFYSTKSATGSIIDLDPCDKISTYAVIRTEILNFLAEGGYLCHTIISLPYSKVHADKLLPTKMTASGPDIIEDQKNGTSVVLLFRFLENPIAEKATNIKGQFANEVKRIGTRIGSLFSSDANKWKIKIVGYYYKLIAPGLADNSNFNNDSMGICDVDRTNMQFWYNFKPHPPSINGLSLEISGKINSLKLEISGKINSLKLEISEKINSLKHAPGTKYFTTNMSVTSLEPSKPSPSYATHFNSDKITATPSPFPSYPIRLMAPSELRK